MDIETYLNRRQQQQKEAKVFRELCMTCRQPSTVCYCEHIKKFDPKIKFVILIHHVEERRRIATGRMSHLCLENSELIVGQDYSENVRVNEIVDDPSFSPVILYPGPTSRNISGPEARSDGEPIFKAGKVPVVFVIDGTWATARKMVRQSQNLFHLPRISFMPVTPSRFRVRKQPRAECYSTIEAIHYTIELLADRVGFSLVDDIHDNLLKVFSALVETQVRFLQESFDNPRSSSYRRPKVRVV